MEHASKKYDDLELRRVGVAGASIYTSLIMNSMSGGGGNVAPSITGVPTISGTTGEGDTLTASPASVTGVPTPTRTWQWKRDAGDIPGATGNTYTLVSADLGTDITVVQTETNAEGTDTATSAATSIPGGLATALRVRESVGNAEADIPLAVDGFVDETALTTHTGAASGFVSVWNDQSGNDNDATQVTQTAQPRIVNAGTVDEGLVFDGTNDFLTPSSVIELASEFTISFWVKRNDTSTFEFILGNLTSDQKLGFSNNSTTFGARLISGGSFATLPHGVDSTQWNHFAIVRNSDNKVDLFVNGGSAVRMFSDAAQAGNVVFSQIGRDNSGAGNSIDGTIATLRIDASDESANIAGIYAGTYEGSPVAWYKATEITP